MSSMTNEASPGAAPYTAWLDLTTRRRTGLEGPAQPASTFIVPMTLVSWAALGSPAESTVDCARSRPRGVPRVDPDPPALLWVYAPHHRRVGDPLHRDRVGGEPHVD